MANKKNKLPTSIIVLNVIMIIIVVVICGLLISLLYGDQFNKEETPPTVEIALGDTVEAAGTAESASTGEAASTSATTKATSSVSMTKRTTEPTEPVDIPDDEPTVYEETEEHVDNFYTKEFFANDLFIGDSITTGIHIFNKLDMKNVAADTGYTPYKAYTDAIPMYDGSSMTALAYAEKMQPKRIFIMLGSNGLATAGVMEDTYGALIDKLTAACPDSVIYCISVTPLAKGSRYEKPDGLNNDAVRKFNTFIKGICSENGMRYIDFYSQVADADGYFLDEYAESDGMHFKSVTYDLMLSHIQNSIS